MQYTIESRPLTSASIPSDRRRASHHEVIIDAEDARHAIAEFVRQNESELVSLTSPRKSSESIATVKKDDRVFLVRVYAA